MPEWEEQIEPEPEDIEPDHNWGCRCDQCRMNAPILIFEPMQEPTQVRNVNTTVHTFNTVCMNEEAEMPKKPVKPDSYVECANCGCKRQARNMFETLDHFFLCKECWPQYSMCPQCGWSTEIEKFKFKDRHRKCEGCSPSDVIQVKRIGKSSKSYISKRKEKVWDSILGRTRNLS